jgi:hypothetical protein
MSILGDALIQGVKAGAKKTVKAAPRVAEREAAKAPARAAKAAPRKAARATAETSSFAVPRRVTPHEVAFDPRIEKRTGELPKVERMAVELSPRPTREAPPVSIYDMEGRPFLTSMSDMSAAGDDITGINDVVLASPMRRMGGQDYMFEQPGSVWASDLSPAGSHLKLAQQLKTETGQNPLFMPWTMGPTAIDFAHMPRELMLKYAEAALNKRERKGLTSEIRNVVPEFRDISDPASIQTFREAAGPQRAALNKLLDLYRGKGGLGMGEARLATTDLGQIGTPLTSLRNVGIIDASAPLSPSAHPSYRTSIPGEGLGRLRENVGALELLPEIMRSANLTDPFGFPVGVTPGVKSPLRSLQMKPKSGIITEDMLRRIEARLREPGKKPIKRSQGGLAVKRKKR